MRVSDTRQLFRYIERRDGRQPLNATNACSAPLVSQSRKIYDTQEKCELLADSFEAKLTSPENKGPHKGGRKGEQIKERWGGINPAFQKEERQHRKADAQTRLEFRRGKTKDKGEEKGLEETEWQWVEAGHTANQ